jgi:hypothetical protein
MEHTNFTFQLIRLRSAHEADLISWYDDENRWTTNADHCHWFASVTQVQEIAICQLMSLKNLGRFERRIIIGRHIGTGDRVIWRLVCDWSTVAFPGADRARKIEPETLLLT